MFSLKPTKLAKIERVEPTASRCLSVDSKDSLFVLANSVVSHNSVSLQNIIIAALLRPDKWEVIGLDMKVVEITNFKDYGVPVAVTRRECADFLLCAQSIMMSRYVLMESMGLKNWENMPKGSGPALLIVIDEISELFSAAVGSGKEAEADREARDIIAMSLSSIARLGRAAQIFIVTATQRPSADVIPMQIRDNLTTRVACGQLKSNLSIMVLDNKEGRYIPANPPGRIGLQIHGGPLNIAQGFFAPDDWFEKYLEKNNVKVKKPTLLTEGGLDLSEQDKTRTPPMTQRAEESWDDDMDKIFEMGNAERKARQDN